MNEVVQYQPGQMPSDPAAVNDYYKQAAEYYSEQERRPGTSISIRNGVMSVGDQPIPGNQFAAVILDSVRLNTFYTQNFNANNIVPPTCYAIAREEQQLAPHPDMQKDLNWFKPQAERCNGCPHNEYGSRGDGTQGKACTNRRRLMLIPAGMYQQVQHGGWQLQPFTDLNHYATAPILSLALSPTMLAGWGQFVRDTFATYQRPPFGVVARVYIYPHPKHGKEAVGFEHIGPTPDDWAPTIIGRHQEASRDIFEGFEPPQPQQHRGGGFYNAQQQASVQQVQTPYNQG